ncbi:MAG: aminopeptidase P family protein [Lagierella massiliensis]|nr:aminopeptidase P family protein [Lagierella massiliensis]
MVVDNIENLRKKMRENAVDMYIIPTSDPHYSENVPNCYKTRQFISGFTGSAGTVIVTLEEAGLWTDGRYFIQAAKQLEGSGIKLYKMGEKGVPSIRDFIFERLTKEYKIGFNGETFPLGLLKQLEEKIPEENFSFNLTLVEDIWEDRPEKPSQEAFLLDEEYTGVSAKDKIHKIRDELDKKGSSSTLITSLDDVAYVLNIRGDDVLFTPVILSYLYINKQRAVFFVHEDKIPEEVKKYLEKSGVEIKAYESVFDFISNLENETLYIDNENINVKLYKSIPEKVKIIEGRDISTDLKAIKNDVEIKNQKNAYIKDGVALVKFFNWLEKSLSNGDKISELDCSNKLLEFRKQQELFIELSFATISAYGENAALPHYTPSEENPVYLENKGLYLLDSGGQFKDGTTDITRTVALGKLTEDEIFHYTLTLKSHIALINALFIEGTKSSSLDIFARGPLWKEGIDFNHGTGHGVGFVLACHEGPQVIARANNDIDMVPGMITSDEPGIYVEGSHGIRIENIMVCVERKETDFGKFLGFESLSLVPIDLKPVDISMLTEEEKNWLNQYHKKCYKELSPYLEGEELDYLKRATKEI